MSKSIATVVCVSELSRLPFGLRRGYTVRFADLELLQEYTLPLATFLLMSGVPLAYCASDDLFFVFSVRLTTLDLAMMISCVLCRGRVEVRLGSESFAEELFAHTVTFKRMLLSSVCANLIFLFALTELFAQQIISIVYLVSVCRHRLPTKPCTIASKRLHSITLSTLTRRKALYPSSRNIYIKILTN